jgi:hypothetical protein
MATTSSRSNRKTYDGLAKRGIMCGAIFLMLLASFALTSATTLAKDPLFSQRIRFKKGQSAAVVTGSITSGEVTRYIFTAKSDQWLVLRLSSTNNAAKFLLSEFGASPSGEMNLADGTEWEGALPDSAEYAINVYSEAKAAKYTLRVSITNLVPTK